MTKKQKLFQKILSGSKNIQFDELTTIVEAFGFSRSRVNGSHHIFVNPHIPEFLNLQNRNGKAIPYQIKQFLKLVEEYSLSMED
ncbi:MAG: type II toxin-antitoxin system HicA family toxin [Xenococcaceae cyanobacterium]